MTDIIHLSDDAFDKFISDSSVPVLVDFWAEWCGPCKQIAPILDDLAKDFAGQLQIAKVNIDNNPQSPQKFNVRGIPTLLLFKNGEEVDRQVGVTSATDLSNFIKAQL